MMPVDEIAQEVEEDRLELGRIDARAREQSNQRIDIDNSRGKNDALPYSFTLAVIASLALAAAICAFIVAVTGRSADNAAHDRQMTLVKDDFAGRFQAAQRDFDTQLKLARERAQSAETQQMLFNDYLRDPNYRSREDISAWGRFKKDHNIQR